MSLLKQKVDFVQRGVYDELYTPPEAVEMILPFIPKDCNTVWECTATSSSKISSVLRVAEYSVVGTHLVDGLDFFDYEPPFNYDIIITNPPYSLKNSFLKRAFGLGKPFMFLLPLTTLEGLERSKMFREHRIQLLIPDMRFNFKPEKNSSAWFATAWFCSGIGLERDLNFISTKKV